MSSFLRSLQRLLRRRRPNRRVGRFARRATTARSFSLGTPTADTHRLWRVLVWAGLALVLSQVEAGLLPHLGRAAIPVDVPLLVVVFCALNLGAIEGALAAFALGWIGDLFVQGPPGLCRFLAVGVWTGVRVASTRIHLPPLVASVAFTFGAGLVYQAGILAGLAFVAEGGGGPGTIAWLSVVPQVVLTALAAAPLHAGLARVEALTEGPQG